MVEGGKFTDNPETGERQYSLNVVPSVCKAGFDMRVPPSVH